mgnify:CR=1 FL=1
MLGVFFMFIGSYLILIHYGNPHPLTSANGLGFWTLLISDQGIDDLIIPAVKHGNGKSPSLDDVSTKNFTSGDFSASNI